jgi:hypothetical protein
MKIIAGPQKFQLRNSHPFAQAILALARAHQRGETATDEIPERNDIKQLWRELNDSHRRLLKEVASRPGGISQKDLQTMLDVDWQGLRGVHNGLARIGERLDCEKPIRVVGYNADNRRYIMDPDVAATVQRLAKKAKAP